ncbi:PadR family transcriptional regulator [Phytoactinopolyspora mesophila]|uniref:PadR family transcriptional regulator n=1 Tax=Phytoactinopolyspora mesophila TaxID=2650750 RepID=A0A7K3MBL9_9ACTN|nr:PadR family transcriptional regulator [Phytoactinopolyspora mesophila]NDL59788.1 PadR family transcriptional regulator [Phytoactinopolyspora mesophila]
MAPPPTRQLVLAIVRLLQPVHGYDVRRELMSWGAEDWANIAPGSIYGALKTLEQDGLISVVDTSRDGHRPARTTYRVTDEGEKQYHSMLRDAWWDAKPAPHPLLAAVAQLPFSNHDDVLAALKARQHRLTSDILVAEREIERIQSGSGDPLHDTPFHVSAMHRLNIALAKAELAWAQDMVHRIKSGDQGVWSWEGPGNPPSSSAGPVP